MLLVEKLGGESSDDVRSYLESLIDAVDPRSAEDFRKYLPFQNEGPWTTLLRIARQVEVRGRTFCEIEWFALRIYCVLTQAIEGGMISRDAIVAYRVGEREHETIETGSVKTELKAYLLSGGRATRLAPADVELAFPVSVHWKIPYRIGRDLDDKDGGS